MTRSDIAALAMKEWLIDNSADAFVRLAQRAFDAGAEAHSATQDAKDARRYRHMRNNAAFRERNGPGLYWYLPRYLYGTSAELLDAAIDDAIKP